MLTQIVTLTASCRLQIAPADLVVSRGKRHAAPAAARLKSASQLKRLTLVRPDLHEGRNLMRCNDGGVAQRLRL